ncbi:MAG TPA: hypothetical protein DDZ88_08310 [Verrucomicrobiales bacterium]|nr:hypothetical protein [Verrucomicrobiales bacterium]
MRPPLLPLLILLVCAHPALQARVFVSLAGTLLEADITAVDGDNVTLQRAGGGQPLVVKRNTLCKEDLAYIARWMEANPDKTTLPSASTAGAPAPARKYNLLCEVQSSKSNRGAADGGPRTVEISYAFHLHNREVQRDLEGASGMILTLGKDATGSGGDLIVLQKVHFDVAIKAQSKIVQSTEKVLLSYFQGAGPRMGVLTHGYVIFILDAAGNVLLSQSNPVGNTKHLKEIQAINEVPCVIDRDFTVQPNAQVPSGYIEF